MRTCLISSVALAPLLVAPALSLAQDQGDTWEYTLTPYLWLPIIDGTLRYSLPPAQPLDPDPGDPDVSVGPTDWLDLLNYGLLLSGTAIKGRLSVLTDLVVISMTSKNDGEIDLVRFGGDRIPIDVTTQGTVRSDLDGLTFTAASGFALGSGGKYSPIVFAGARFFGLDAGSSWSLTVDIDAPGGGVALPASGSIDSDSDLWDGIVGVRGRLGSAGSAWSVPYYLDAGTGSSDLTWNAVLGVSREFDWGDLLLAYRYLEYDQDPDKLLQDFSFSGLGFGARFKF